MKVIDTTHQFGYNQWITGFVSKVLANADINGDSAVIIGICNKKIHLSVNCQAYTIHMKNFFPTHKDQNGMTCSEDVEYTLFAGDGFNDPNSLKKISSGILNIEWDNDAAFFKSDFDPHIDLYGDSEELENLQVDNELMLHVETVNHGHFGLTLDLRTFTPEERVAIAYYFGKNTHDEVYITPEVMRYLKHVHQTCVKDLTETCFEDGDFDPNYTRWLLLCCSSNKLCSRQRVVEEEQTLSRLYADYQNGDVTAPDRIKGNLNAFITEVKPYIISIAVD